MEVIGGPADKQIIPQWRLHIACRRRQYSQNKKLTSGQTLSLRSSKCEQIIGTKIAPNEQIGKTMKDSRNSEKAWRVYSNKGPVINYQRGRVGVVGAGGYEMGNRQSKICCVPLSRQDETFCAYPFKGWTFFAPLSSMTKTLSSRVKITPKPFVPLPPSAWL